MHAAAAGSVELCMLVWPIDLWSALEACDDDDGIGADDGASTLGHHAVCMAAIEAICPAAVRSCRL
jgi:hypothetical protein